MPEITLPMPFTRGTNLKGQVTGANWLFLLPNLELEGVVCIGTPPLTTLVPLSRLSHRVLVNCHNTRQAEAVRVLSQKNDLTNVHAIVGSDRLASLPTNSADLILLAGRYTTWQFGRDQTLVADIQRLLKPGGLTYSEPVWLSTSEAEGDRDQNLGPSQLLWLSPLVGEMQAAVPLHDARTTGYFLQHRHCGSSVKVPILDKAARLLDHFPFLSRFTRRVGVFTGQEIASLVYQPPRYLREIAHEAGVDIDHHRWGLSACSRYNLDKVLFFLFDQASPSPSYIVKITRDTAFNARLENEYHALALLREKEIGTHETLPQPLFLGSHGGLAILGKTAIDGAPFCQHTRGTVDDPHGRMAIEWLTTLGVATADSTMTTPAQVAEGLWQLFVRFLETYCLTLEQTVFLAEQIDTIRRHRGTFPLVFQNGDPDTRNLIVTNGGQIAFLDWEAAEPHGMPLWDLFYFLHSYCTWTARQRGTRNSLEDFMQHFLAESTLSSLLNEASRHYCQQIGLSEHLIEPLFYTCWVNRAIKHATRLSPAKLEGGHYVNLLRLCIDRRNVSALRRLFSRKTEARVSGSLSAK